MEVNYIAIELKTNNEGGTGVDVLYSGKDRRVAEQKYHTALATAATSGRPMHAAVLMQSDGMVITSEFYATEKDA